MLHSKRASPYELALRKFPDVVHMLTLLPFYALCILVMGASAAPGIALFMAALERTADLGAVTRPLGLGFALAGAYLAYGLSLVAVAPFANFCLRCNLKPWRGSYHSAETVKWYVHNGLTYVARFTFLDFITPTPLNVLFYRLMGMKVGRDTQINSSSISDPSMITIGDRVTVGGSATIIGHYGIGGLLILTRTEIADDVTIGLRAVIMGGVQIGAGAKILPNSVVMPKTKVGAGETWGGVPAVRLENPARAVTG